MADEKRSRGMLKRVLLRILKAVFWSFLMGGGALFFLLIPGLNQYVTTFLPINQIGFSGFLVMLILFEICIQLLSGTVLKHVLSAARALISILYLFLVTNGGVMTMNIPQQMLPLGFGTMQLTIKFEEILMMFLTLSLVSIVKNLLQTIHFLSERAEQPVTLAEVP